MLSVQWDDSCGFTSIGHVGKRCRSAVQLSSATTSDLHRYEDSDLNQQDRAGCSMDLSRLTARQQLKYLEEEARKDAERQEQVETEEVFPGQSSIGSWTRAVAPTDPSREVRVKITCTPEDSIDNNKAHNEDTMGDSKRKGEGIQARLERLKKKRRISKDDDDDSENEMEFGDDEESSSQAKAENIEDDPSKVKPDEGNSQPEKKPESIQSKFLKRVQDKQKEREKKKATKEEQQEKEKDSKAKKSPTLAIPKKSSSVGIPRKSTDATKKKEPSSLLSEYMAPPMAKVGAAQSGMAVKSTQAASAPASSDADSASASLQLVKPEGKNRIPQRGQELASNVVGSSQVGRHPDGQVAATSPQRQAPQRLKGQQKGASSSRPNTSMAVRVLESLSEACTKLADDPDSKFRLSGRGTGNNSSSSIDWASLLTHREYDFYDVDAKGNIVMQPLIPIFPEDFPLGMPPWPLSWWGIVDPSLAEEQQQETKKQEIKKQEIKKQEIKRQETKKQERLESKKRRTDSAMSKDPIKVDPALSASSSSRKLDRPSPPQIGDGEFQHNRNRDRTPPNVRDGVGGVNGDYYGDRRGDDYYRRHPGHGPPIGPASGRGGLPPPAFESQRHPPPRGPPSYDRRRAPSPQNHPSRGLPPPSFEPRHGLAPPRGGPPFDRRRGPSPPIHGSRGLPPPHINARGHPYPDRLGPPPDFHRRPDRGPDRGPPHHRRKHSPDSPPRGTSRRDRRSGSRD